MNYLLAPHIAAQVNGSDFGPGGLESVDPRIAGTLDHRPGCRRPRLILLVRVTDQVPVLRCSSCNQYLILRGRWLFDVLESAGFTVGPRDWTMAPPRPRKVPLPQETPPPAPDGVSRYWCRDHPDQPTDHRGRGCLECRQ